MAGSTRRWLRCFGRSAPQRARRSAAIWGAACAWLRISAVGAPLTWCPQRPPSLSLRCAAAASAAPASFPEGQDLSELFDVCEAPAAANALLPTGTAPALAGGVKQRRLVHRDGDWHRSVHIWLLDERGELLLQRRSEHKDTHPGRWDVSCAGHIGAGDGGPDTAVRELEEELGLAVAPTALEPLFTIAASATGSTARHGPFRCNEYQEVFLLRVRGDHASRGYRPAEGEVAELRSEPAGETERFLRAGDAGYVPRSPAYIDALAAALSRGAGARAAG